MKTFFKLLIVISVLQVGKVNAQDFYDYVLDSFTNYSSYVLVNIESDEYNGKAVIENRKLYSFLKKSGKLDGTTYKIYMTKLLSSNSKLSLENADIEKQGFVKVIVSESVKKSALEGKESFIKKYFNERTLRYDVNENIFDIITKLFEWRIVTKIEDETGYLKMIRTDLIKEK